MDHNLNFLRTSQKVTFDLKRMLPKSVQLCKYNSIPTIKKKIEKKPNSEINEQGQLVNIQLIKETDKDEL